MSIHSDQSAAAVLRHRSNGHSVDASIELERWVAACRRQSQAYTVPEALLGGASAIHHHHTPPHSTSKNLLQSTRNLLSRGGQTPRQGSQEMFYGDEAAAEAAAELRERTPRLRRLIEREGAGAETLTFVAPVRKTNAVGRVQSRLLLITDFAAYNVDADGKKIKRRIPLASISLVTASEHTGQFILHVPSEYDYLFAVYLKGYSPLDDSTPHGSALSGLLAALQRAYASFAQRAPALLPQGAQAQLPVRSWGVEAAPMSALVKKKSRAALGEMGGGGGGYGGGGGGGELQLRESMGQDFDEDDD